MKSDMNDTQVSSKAGVKEAEPRSKASAAAPKKLKHGMDRDQFKNRDKDDELQYCDIDVLK